MRKLLYKLGNIKKQMTKKYQIASDWSRDRVTLIEAEGLQGRGIVCYIERIYS